MKAAQANYEFRHEEMANTITACIGVAGSLIACCLLIVQAFSNPSLYGAIAAGVYGFSLLLVFVASACYHSLPESPRKHFFKALDHAAIFLLIAGTYTPFGLIVLDREIGKPVLITVWAAAVIGAVLKLLRQGSLERAHFSLYLALGWVAVFFGTRLTSQLSSDMLFWLLLGGGFFTGGAVFYALKKVLYHHAAWHIAVICGCFCHFIAVWKHALA
jgi:hemolysin III